MPQPKLYILGHVYRIIREQKKGWAGHCDTRQAVVAVYPGSAATIQGETLVHEVIHAISDAAGIRCTERQVGQLAVGLHHFLTANPEYARKIIRRQRIL